MTLEKSVCEENETEKLLEEKQRVSFLLPRLSCNGWRAMARSRLTATSASRVQVILLPQPPDWDYRHAPPYPANFCIFIRDEGFTMLVIYPPWPPKVLGLQREPPCLANSPFYMLTYTASTFALSQHLFYHLIRAYRT
ncbi:LOW QUALITY PROTEIN: Ankyrin repeat and death domain-containing protein 1A [Plecturocebus cupreus]